MSSLTCIPLWQPYASLIAIGAKRFETRHWAPPRRLVGHRVAIFACKRKVTRDEFAFLDELASDAFGFCHWHARIPYGAIVATARLNAVYQVENCFEEFVFLKPYATSFGVPNKCTFRNDGFGDYAPGRYCWEMTDVQPLAEPVPYKGQQGLFQVPWPPQQAAA